MNKNPVKDNKNIKRCPYCGAVINEDDAFCHNCLHPLKKFKDEQPMEFLDNDVQ